VTSKPLEFKETGRIQKGMTDYRHMKVVGRQEGSRFIPEHLNGPAERSPSGRFKCDDDTYSIITTASLPYGSSGVNFINILHSTFL